MYGDVLIFNGVGAPSAISISLENLNISENLYEMEQLGSMVEKQPWGKTVYDCISGSHIQFQTERAKVDLITNPWFGRILFIDGVLQSCTGDEHLYHIPFTREALGYRPQTRILIAGSAEGALLRQIEDVDGECNLGVKEIVMVDWDKQLVEHMRDNEPWSRGSFDEPRLELHYEDIEAFLEKDNRKYTSILLDLVDMDTKEEKEWLDKILNIAKTRLESKGVLTWNGGRHRVWPGYKVKEIIVPSFQEPWHIVSYTKE
jgi:spermidine synthase